MDFSDREDLRLLAERFTYLRLSAANTPNVARRPASRLVGSRARPPIQSRLRHRVRTKARQRVPGRCSG